jgi:NADH:ubiquinone oxidoreductase subunit 5 (subunit L)/multisubunit Na+/H+ antiporter MnhA subunit
MDFKNILLLDPLSKLVSTFIIFFTIIIFVYSLGFIKTRKIEYYLWFFLTAIASLAAVLSSNLIWIVIFWGFIGLALFKLINLYSDIDKEITSVA